MWIGRFFGRSKSFCWFHRQKEIGVCDSFIHFTIRIKRDKKNTIALNWIELNWTEFNSQQSLWSIYPLSINARKLTHQNKIVCVCVCINSHPPKQRNKQCVKSHFPISHTADCFGFLSVCCSTTRTLCCLSDSHSICALISSESSRNFTAWTKFTSFEKDAIFEMMAIFCCCCSCSCSCCCCWETIFLYHTRTLGWVLQSRLIKMIVMRFTCVD